MSNLVTDIRLRADVARCIDLHVAESLNTPRDHRIWRLYADFKKALSKLVGWNAPDELQDQAMYDNAIQLFLHRAEL